MNKVSCFRIRNCSNRTIRFITDNVRTCLAFFFNLRQMNVSKRCDVTYLKKIYGQGSMPLSEIFIFIYISVSKYRRKYFKKTLHSIQYIGIWLPT